MAVTEHRTRKDRALRIKEMLDECYSGAIKARLVMDNLNIHSIASLYETFEPMEARCPAKRPDIHYTPKHGS
ncbi:MAG: transposase [Thermoleophilia bacterium]